MELSIKNVLDNIDNEALTYVNKGDIQKCYQDCQILVLEAPLGANLSIDKVVTAMVINISNQNSNK